MTHVDDLNPVIISLYMDNVNPDVVYHQRSVVDLFRGSIPFEQLQTIHSHGKTMDLVMKSLAKYSSKDRLVIFLDIDAIPLLPTSFDTLICMTMDGATMAGAPQSTNHLPQASGVFVAPCIMAISTRLYREIGMPSAEPTESSDVAELWTKELQETHKIPASFFDILNYDGSPAPVRLGNGSVISVSHWMLDDSAGTKFGLNTTYGFETEQLFFHSYQSFVSGQNEYFINKCKALVERYTQH